MEVLYPRCAGLDVHAGSVTACARIASGTQVTYEHRTVATASRGLLELAEWLTAHGCTHVAMEATGVYWKPVWHVLEEHVTLVLANAMHIRNVPGRKSDMNDATWIADPLAHGLIRSSFVPPAPGSAPAFHASGTHLVYSVLSGRVRGRTWLDGSTAVSEAHESRLKTTSRATPGNSSAVVPAGQSTTSGAAAAPQMQVLLNSFEELRSRV